MDEIESLVAETFRHFNENYCLVETKELTAPAKSTEEMELSTSPGLLYHIQQTASIFVVRSFVSRNIREDYLKILEHPENYPTLRLIEGGTEDLEKKLRFFLVDNAYQAEIIHDQISNRRFPINEELMCNLSDPGFSWWLTDKNNGFQVSFTFSVAMNSSVKLGPLGDREVALKNFQDLERLMNEAGLKLNIENEMNRVQVNEGEELLLEELKDLFEFGVIGEGFCDLFKILAKRLPKQSTLETLWFYFQEIAAVRRFWIQVQYDLEAL